MKRVSLSLLLVLVAFPAVAPSAAADATDCTYERPYATALLIHRFECDQGWTGPFVSVDDPGDPCYSVHIGAYVLEVRLVQSCVDQTTGHVGVATVGTIYVTNY